MKKLKILLTIVALAIVGVVAVYAMMPARQSPKPAPVETQMMP